MASAVDPSAPADHSNPPEIVDCLTDGEEVVNEVMGGEDPDKLKRGIIEHLQKSRSPGLPKLAEKTALLKEAGKLAFLPRGFTTGNAKVAEFVAELASMFVNKSKATAVTTAPLLYLLFEIFESHDQYVEAVKAADAAITRTTRNNGKKRAAVPMKDPPFVHRLRSWIQAATESFLVAEDRVPSNLAAKIRKYRFPTQYKHLLYHVDSVTEVGLFCPFCAADGHQSTMVVYEATVHQTMTAQAKPEFADRMATYNNLTQQQQKSTKPPRCKLPKMKAACICTVQHNHGNIEGGDCRDCCLAYESDPVVLLCCMRVHLQCALSN
jgi:hypothetical protein